MRHTDPNPFRRVIGSLRAVARHAATLPTVRRLGRLLPRRFRQWAAGLMDTEGSRDRRTLALVRSVGARLRESDRRETAAWQRVRTWSDWEAFREPRLAALRRALGGLQPDAGAPMVRTTRTRNGNGFCVENLVFAGALGATVTANLYRPSKPTGPVPGFVICHSHHHPKDEAELQTMGATWARCGCMVLVMDQLGHGERRQHPFRAPQDYPAPFRVGRQDYYFRYNIGMQLSLIGESLMGCMVFDLMRGVDLLLDRPRADPARIILIGSVAGGGDPAAVTAALDPRIAAVVPFGFGKAHADPGRSGPEVDFTGRGSWESTRNLRRSAGDGFAPWMILGAVAPRRLVYAHEFAWEPRNDPAWERLRRIFDLAGVPDHLTAIHGSGSVRGRSANDTHCNNVGPIHRRQLYRVLDDWFGIPVPVEEHRAVCRGDELICIDPQEGLSSAPVHRLAATSARDRLAAARRRIHGLEGQARRESLRRGLAPWLGRIEPYPTRMRVHRRRTSRGLRREDGELETEPGVTVTTHLLLPEAGGDRVPIVIAVGQQGNRSLLRHRRNVIAGLLRDGIALCSAELRGTGGPGTGHAFRGRPSIATAVSSSEMMLGETLLGARLRDLRSVLRFVRTVPGVDPGRIAIWGDSLAPPNGDDLELSVPFDVEPAPDLCEPLGGLSGLLAGLFEDDLRAIYVCGGLAGYASMLDSPFCYVPYDAVVPGVLTVADVGDIASSLAPLPLRIEAFVDGRNRRLATDELARTMAEARKAYAKAGADDRLSLFGRKQPGTDVARWFRTHLKLRGVPRSC